MFGPVALIMLAMARAFSESCIRAPEVVNSWSLGETGDEERSYLADYFIAAEPVNSCVEYVLDHSEPGQSRRWPMQAHRRAQVGDVSIAVTNRRDRHFLSWLGLFYIWRVPPVGCGLEILLELPPVFEAGGALL